jgi:transposase
MGISRATASKWVNRYHRYGELGLLDRSSAPHRQPTATPGRLVESIETMRRERKWSASRIAFELEQDGTPVSRRTITRVLAQLGLNRRRFMDPNGEVNRKPQQIIAERPGHMVHIDVKKVGRMHLDLRDRASRRAQHVESALQLPPTARRPRRPAARVTNVLASYN